ncbi:MAG: cupin domain-containing protein [Calditrichia bacterium]|nr:cupin domain-containing protein [Calditrichia bacterium]
MKVNKKRPDENEVKSMNIKSWPIWEKEVSEFDWHYDNAEQFYVLEGKVQVIYGNEQIIEFGTGDLVTFPAGTSCRWKVIEPIRKHYTFPD